MYKKMYLILVDAISNGINLLQKALIEAESIYIENDNSTLTLTAQEEDPTL